jgi:phytoene dehydrogenase-like protein
MEIDNIIIGSGAGGLSAALCLARAGQRVLVLEQHDVPGGWCHSFYLNGYRFSPGVHYIGLLDKGQSTSELFEGLGIANDLVFFKMNAAAYEHFWIGEEHIDMPADFDELYKVLSERFPDEKKGLAKYLNTVRNVSRQLQLIPKMSGLWDNLTIPWHTRHLGKYGLFSLKKVIDWHIKERLTEKIINSLEKVLLGISRKIVQKELGTPMNNEFYINSTNGCVYGTEKSFRQIGPFSFKPESEIKNMYLCGASILSHGVAGASYSGVQTAAKILKCSQDDLIKPDHSQNLRVYDAEDSSEYPEWMQKKTEVRRARLATKG